MARDALAELAGAEKVVSVSPELLKKLLERMMDQKTDNGRTPIERIKAEHALKREQVLSGEIDELEWTGDIAPEQVGLKQVWADDNGKLWVFVRHGDRMKLRRVLEA